MTSKTNPPVVNAAERFNQLCQAMVTELGKLEPDQDVWGKLEAQALALLEKNIFIDKHILGPGLCLTGSSRILHKLHTQTSEETWADYLHNAVHVFTSYTLRQLPMNDITWLIQQGFAKSLFRPSLPVIIGDDDLELLNVISEGNNTRASDTLWCALAIIPGNLAALPILADQIVAVLREEVKAKHEHGILTDLLENALSKRDLRLTSLLMSLGADIPLEGGPISWTQDQHLLELLSKTGSFHGRLQLITMEPNPASILARPSPGPFHGIYEIVPPEAD